MSVFADVDLAPPDAIFDLARRFKEDKFEQKVNLTVGAYRDDEGKPWVLPTVREAERRVLDQQYNHEYLPIGGDEEFVQAAIRVWMGEKSELLAQERVAAVQTLSGTGSIRVAAHFLKTFLPGRVVYISNPTWANHWKIFEKAEVQTAKYRYFNPKTCGLDFAGMIQDLRKAPEGSIVLLHACAHNPTGVDPSRAQWREIAELCNERNFLPFFDMAYQGFASGDLDKDVAFVREIFAPSVSDFLMAQSFAKNMGLYNERCGTLSVVCGTKDAASRVLSQLKATIRPMYSNPPAYGSRIVKTVLKDPELYAMWKRDVHTMAGRVLRMRATLYDHLKAHGTPGTWDHITSQIGMFTFTGLDHTQCQILINEFHVYLLQNGRINMCGLNDSNVEYVAKAIDNVVRRKSHKL
eukprot:Clim_evm9s9 gene=Clim_evmTU9s9